MVLKRWKILGTLLPVPILIGLLLMMASPAQALLISVPAPNAVNNTSSISVP